MPNKLIVLSVDALFDEDIPFLRTLPNFGRFLQNAAIVDGGMRSVYPSLTYPCHVSLITGAHPAQHGIYDNEVFDLNNPKPDWRWFHCDIRVPTVIDAAKQAGLTTGVVMWPVMAGCPTADYLIPEIWAPTFEEDPRIRFEPAASPWIMPIYERHAHNLRRNVQPYFDRFGFACAVDIIREFAPDVLFIHGASVDHKRHDYGIFGREVESAVLYNDEWFGHIVDATKEAGVFEQTNFFLVSDHGHLPARRMFFPNVLFARAGLLQTDAVGNITAWDAVCRSTALSCQVYLRDPTTSAVRKRVETLLREMLLTPEYGVEAVFTAEELLREQQVAGPFEYMIEGEGGTAFGNSATGDVLRSTADPDFKYNVTGHGHLPHKGVQPLFAACGPDILPSAALPRQRIVDAAPTFAKLLGIELPGAVGKPLDGLLK